MTCDACNYQFPADTVEGAPCPICAAYYDRPDSDWRIGGLIALGFAACIAVGIWLLVRQ